VDALAVTRLLFVLSLVVSAPSALLAQPAPPALTGAVNDFANVIDGTARHQIADLSKRVEQATGDILVVATVDTVQPQDIQSYATKMFENSGRGIGFRGKDNGVLILLAVRDRRVRVEVGYALEEFITDGFAGEVSRQTMTPYFRTGEYGQGLKAGAEAIAQRLAEARNTSIPGVARREPPRQRTGSGGFPIGLIVFLLIWILISRPWRRRRRRAWGGGPWSGWSSGVGPFGGGFGGGMGGSWGGGWSGSGSGGFGGGFGGFGGGRSGGGGGGASW
jgi:uncharacterized protein